MRKYSIHTPLIDDITLSDDDFDSDSENSNAEPSCIDNLQQRIVNALIFYSQYHQHPVNQKIHTACIPLIMWTTMVWCSQVPISPEENLNDYLNLTNLLSLAYFFGYMLYDKKIGAVSGVLLAGLAVSAREFAVNVPYANFTALGIHLAGWIAQIIGHKHWEGNRPALLDSLGQALYIAPLFCLIEACGFLGIDLKTDKKNLLYSASLFQDNNSSDEENEQNTQQGYPR